MNVPTRKLLGSLSRAMGNNISEIKEAPQTTTFYILHKLSKEDVRLIRSISKHFLKSTRMRARVSANKVEVTSPE